MDLRACQLRDYEAMKDVRKEIVKMWYGQDGSVHKVHI